MALIINFARLISNLFSAFDEAMEARRVAHKKYRYRYVPEE